MVFPIQSWGGKYSKFQGHNQLPTHHLWISISNFLCILKTLICQIFGLLHLTAVSDCQEKKKGHFWFNQHVSIATTSLCPRFDDMQYKWIFDRVTKIPVKIVANRMEATSLLGCGWIQNTSDSWVWTRWWLSHDFVLRLLFLYSLVFCVFLYFLYIYELWLYPRRGLSHDIFVCMYSLV